jgi:hypothetical protein
LLRWAGVTLYLSASNALIKPEISKVLATAKHRYANLECSMVFGYRKKGLKSQKITFADEVKDMVGHIR